MNNSMIDDFLYKAKIMDTGEWIEGFVIKKGSNECIPFCLPIPLSKRFIKRTILEVVGNTINRSNSEK